jgi:hypothetical protein
MLERLLRSIADGDGAFSLAGMARTLETSETMVATMVESLVCLGYLVPVEAGCDAGQCRRCSARSSCGNAAAARLWVLSEKGKQAAAR